MFHEQESSNDFVKWHPAREFDSGQGRRSEFALAYELPQL
jgi:hypothetical protein